MAKRSFPKPKTAVLAIDRRLSDGYVVVGLPQEIGRPRVFSRHFTLLGLKPGDTGKVKVTIERIE